MANQWNRKSSAKESLLGSQRQRREPAPPPKSHSSHGLLQTRDQDPRPFMETCLPACCGQRPLSGGTWAALLTKTPPKTPWDSSWQPGSSDCAQPGEDSQIPEDWGGKPSFASGSENQHASGLGAGSLETQKTGEIQAVITTLQSRKCGSRRGGLGGREVDSEE